MRELTLPQIHRRLNNPALLTNISQVHALWYSELGCLQP